MKQWYWFFIVALSVNSLALQAQDERFLREIFSGDVLKSEADTIESIKKVHFIAPGPLYQIDLTGNDRNESILIEKRDGQDWFHLYSYEMKNVLSYKLTPRAANSVVYRLRMVRLSQNVMGLLIHHYEGLNQYLETHANSRVHMLTIENNDLSTASVSPGPRYWVELQKGRETFSRRKYSIEFVDLDKTGIKELILRYNNINAVYKFMGKGKWIQI
jgi:hypothetical protein